MGISHRAVGGFGVVVGLLMSAVVASSASASPEFVGPFPKSFTSVSKKSSLGIGAHGNILKCSSGSTNGEITGPSGGTATLKLNGCKGYGVPGGTAQCADIGAGSEELVSPGLSATLGYINASKKQVGLDLAPATGPFNTFYCQNTAGVLKAEVLGSVIGKLTPVNKQVTPPGTFKLSFKFNTKTHIQEPTGFEGQPADTLTVRLDEGPTEAAAFASAFTMGFTAPTKIKA